MDSQSFTGLKENFFNDLDFVSNQICKVFIYPFVGRSKKVMCCYIALYAFLCITIFQLALTLILTKFKDWFEVVNIAPNLGVCVLILLKYSKINSNQIFYDETLKHFKTNLWEIVDSESKQHKSIVGQYNRVTNFIIHIQYWYMYLLVIIVATFPKIIMFYDTQILGHEIKHLYPFNGWYPFDKVKWYNMVYIWESLMSTVVVALYSFVDILHILFARNVCMELKILGSTVENLISTKDRWNIAKQRFLIETHEKINIKLKTVIKRHQMLIGMVANLEEVLGSGNLLIYIFGSVFICLTILTALMVDDLYMKLRYFSFFFSLLFEVFIQCMIGQILIDQSKDLEQAIYFADWPYADRETRRMLLVFLIRAQRPLKLSAKGFLVMNLDTFGRVCSLSYQFFNLLRTAYS